jgi:uncharacterized membrane protein YphA (DoxX/SURF4 family)
VQGLLATTILMAGAMKLGQSKDELLASGSMDWTEDFAPGQIKGIGMLEVLAAIGLTVPSALDVVPVLTALAATGVVLLMIGAAAIHLRRGEQPMVLANILIAGLALFVAIERLGPHSL